MQQKDQQAFLLWAKTEEFQALMHDTMNRMKKWSKQFSHPYISFSGGKDSTALLHMVLATWNPQQVIVWHWDYGPWLMPRPYQRESIEIANALISDSGASLLIYRRPGGIDARSTSNIGYRKFFASLKMMSKEYERDAGLAGLRAAESISRRIRTRKYYEIDSATGLKLLFPLADWKSVDVWAYLISNNIKYHSIYDKYAEILSGYDSETTRFVTFFDGEMEKFGAPTIDGVLSWRFRHSPI